MTTSDIEALRRRAIAPGQLRGDGRLTMPRSWGVYRLPAGVTGTRVFRSGNHPVRMRELEAEFGACTLVHLFTSREDARAMAAALGEIGA